MKYKVGDYISGPHMVYLEIVVALDGDVPTYATLSPKTNAGFNWVTEWLLDKLGFSKSNPDFKKWEHLKAGDLIRVAEDGEHKAHTHKVVARLADAVLLSVEPRSRQDSNNLQDLERQINELQSEMREYFPTRDLGIQLLKEVKPSSWDLRINEYLTGTNAYNLAGDWFTVRQLALMGWELLSEE